MKHYQQIIVKDFTEQDAASQYEAFTAGIHIYVGILCLFLAIFVASAFRVYMKYKKLDAVLSCAIFVLLTGIALFLYATPSKEQFIETLINEPGTTLVSDK